MKVGTGSGRGNEQSDLQLDRQTRLKDVAALKGKLIGLADEAGTITISTRRLLALRGLRKEEFRFKTIEGTPARYACLKRGDCDAVPLGQPHDLQALKEGYRLLGSE